MERDITRSLKTIESKSKVSPDVDTGRMSSKATSAGQRWRDLFGRNARGAAPDVDTSGLSSKATAAGQDFGSKFSAGAKAGLAALGAASLASTVANQFRQVMAVGMDWTNNMNTLRAVTGASAQEMKAVGEAARALGTDITLPATSANDAASAMTELAKGGFTVQQSMEAARGSLQLAAAAGISATEAATIQSSALQAFGLGADQAGKIADTLANAANASSAEITDVAQALQQAGTVANQFGLSAQDTASAIALLANNGIKGSDAGTLLKSSLLALTDQGNPAQGAIKQLGLTVYDAQGKFVGLSDLMGQLGEASKRMTPEAYQAATATLFGSDAMRLAGVAAKDGAVSYDKMREAIDRQGAAADVAAAKTQGLPGAWERVKNALESLQLKAYDAIEGPLSKLLDGVAAAMDSVGQLGESSAFTSIAEAVKSAAPGVADIAVSLGKAAGAVGVVAWNALTQALSGVAEVLKVLSPLLKAVGSFMRDNQGLVTAFVAAWAGFKFLPGILSPVGAALGNITSKAKGVKTGVADMADSWRTLVTYTQQADPTLSRADARLGALKSSASNAVSGGFNVLKAGVGGLVGALGGPLGVALTGATIAFGAVASKNAEASAAAAGYTEAVKASTEAQVSLSEALLRSNGLMDEQAKLEAGKRIQAAQGEIDAQSKSQASFLDRFRDEQGSLLVGFLDGGSATSLADVKDATARVAGDAKAAIDNLKLSQEALQSQVTGAQPTFDALTAALEKQGEGGALAAQKLREAREEILGAQQAATTAAPVLAKLGAPVEESAARIKTAFAALPTNVPINVEAPGGDEVYNLLQQLGVEVNTNNDKQITVDAPMAPEVIETLRALGIEVTTNNDKTITVSQVGAEEASSQIDQAARDREATIRVITETAAAGVEAGAALGVAPITPRADGAIVPMANGGLRMIDKPDQADIYAGAGAGTIFAEEETGGEAYIPLAPAKRSRSTAILAEVARLFGLQLSAPTGSAGASVSVGSGGGDLVSALSQAVTAPIVSALDGIRAALSSRSSYSGSSPMPVRLAGSGFDSALLAKVPSGVYSQTQAADLTQGLADCSSAVEDLVNLMDGMPTAGRQMSTGNAAEWLTSRGFLPTDTPVPGTFQVGFNDRHMEATLPGGTKFNWGGADSAASGGTTGAAGAWDPSFTQHYYRAVSALDENTEAWSTLTATSNDLNSALQDRTTAETDMADAVGGQAEVVTQIDQAANQSQPGGMDGSSLGQSIVGGMLQSIGLDGSLFSNPFEWPNVKSAMAALNWGGGMLQGLMAGGGDQGGAPMTEGGGGGFGIPGIPNIADMIKPLPNGAIQPAAQQQTQHTPGGPPGPSVVVNGNVGMDPRSFTQRIDAHQNQAYRRNISAVRPG